MKEYLSNKYKSIYVDETQDLNEFQHMLIKVLVDECQLNCKCQLKNVVLALKNVGD